MAHALSCRASSFLAASFCTTRVSASIRQAEEVSTVWTVDFVPCEIKEDLLPLCLAPNWEYADPEAGPVDAFFPGDPGDADVGVSCASSSFSRYARQFRPKRQTSYLNQRLTV